mgnify:CR=1 FL=1
MHDQESHVIVRSIIPLILLIFFANTTAISSQTHASVYDEMDEIFLSFRYQGGINTNFIAYHYNGKYYLPVMDVFRSLLINVEFDERRNTLRGFYIQTNRTYEFNFTNYSARYSGRPVTFTADNAFIDELDVYFEMEYLNSIFGFFFEVDFSTMILKLSTTERMPIILRYERERARERMVSSRNVVSTFPVKYDRQHKVFAPGFLDYGSNTLVTQDGNYTSSLGLSFGSEILFGDVQGNFNMTLRNGDYSSLLQTYRYRYVFRDNALATQLFLGKVGGQAPNFGNIEGFRLTNNPLIPERTFEEFTLDEVTIPDSDIELFLNERLVDFTRSDESGRFAFPLSLTYGVTEIRLVTYGPNGERLESNRRFEIPFNFVPKGRLRYDFGAGRTPSRNITRLKDDYAFYGVGRYSPFRFMTSSLALEYLYTDIDPIFVATTSTSFRFFRNLLFNVDFSPENYVRTDGYLQTGRGTFVRGYYNQNSSNNNLNRTGASDQYGFSGYHPIQFPYFGLAFRGSYDVTNFSLFTLHRTNYEMTMRIRRVGLRAGVRDNLRLSGDDNRTLERRITGSMTYTFPRSPSYPVLLRGLYSRFQVDASENLNQITRLNLNMSKSIGGSSRMQFNWQYDVQNNFNNFFVTFTYDFNKVRAGTSLRYNRGSLSVNSSLRGSIAYDNVNNMLWFDNRSQVGRASVSPILFIDNNENLSYDPEVDELLDDAAVRLLGTGARVSRQGPHVAISQLQPYYQYDVEINKSFLRDPFLVSAFDNFSIITDPNQHKRVEIPMVRTGLIDGEVYRTLPNGTTQGVGGLRLILRGVNSDYNQVHRTFADGSYYIFEVPPGEYELYIDSTQTAFMNVVSLPAVRNIRVRSMQGGDMIDNVSFNLVPSTQIEGEPIIPDVTEPVTEPVTPITQVTPPVVPVTPPTEPVTPPVVPVTPPTEPVTPPVVPVTPPTEPVTPPVVPVTPPTEPVTPPVVPVTPPTEPVTPPVVHVTPVLPPLASDTLSVVADTLITAVSPVAIDSTSITDQPTTDLVTPPAAQDTIPVIHAPVVDTIAPVAIDSVAIVDSLQPILDTQVVQVTPPVVPTEPIVQDVSEDQVEEIIEQMIEEITGTTSTYELQVGAFDTQNYARSIARRYSQRTDYDFTVVYNPASNKYTVRIVGIESMAYMQHLRGEVARILGITDAFPIEVQSSEPQTMTGTAYEVPAVIPTSSDTTRRTATPPVDGTPAVVTPPVTPAATPTQTPAQTPTTEPTPATQAAQTTPAPAQTPVQTPVQAPAPAPTPATQAAQTTPAPASAVTYDLQVGSFTNELHANNVAEQYQQRTGLDFVVYFNPAVNRYTVRLRGFNTLRQAREAQQVVVRDLGLTDTFILRN